MDRTVTQNHFGFRGPEGSNPHDPLCDYFDEKKVSGGEYLTNFAIDRSTLTRAIRELVCRGIQGSTFGQHDIRRVRRWFLDIKSQHAFTMDVSADLLRWCVDLWSTKANSPFGRSIAPCSVDMREGVAVVGSPARLRFCPASHLRTTLGLRLWAIATAATDAPAWRHS